MNSAAQVDQMFQGWKQEGRTKEELIVRTAEAELGWPYVWGAVGAQCTPSKREAYAERGSCPAGEPDQIRKTCPVLSGKQSECDGCQWYPNGERVLIDDCQGFIKQICNRVGISFKGGGCSSMWRDNSNWIDKGTIDTLPEKLCCLFWQNSKEPSKMDHIGFYVGNGYMIHCSGTVKKEKVSKRCTHWAIPKGLGGDTPMPTRPTIRRGSQGEDVQYLQEQLIKAGYDLGSYGADGKFGAKTEAAVKDFQRDHGLKADGIVGPATWGEIEQIDPKPTVLYTVTIKHLPLYQVEALKERYDGAVIVTEEG